MLSGYEKVPSSKSNVQSYDETLLTLDMGHGIWDFAMITGFNTDVEHDGTTYHVQTEDKGLDSPLILSLVYVGGAILASKRSPYDDLIAKGFDERELAERLNRQHKLICAAIRAGRIEDLKRMSQRDSSAPSSSSPAPEAIEAEVIETPRVEAQAINQTSDEEAAPLEIPPLQSATQPTAQMQTHDAAAPQPEVKVKKAAQSQQKGVRQAVRSILHDVVADFTRAETASETGIHLSLIDEGEFRGGQLVMLKIRVGRGSSGSEAIAGADVTVKVLGSTFRPLIFPTKTGQDGIASVRAALPHFQTGRAAILVRAIANGYEAELRRIIHQG